MEPSLLRPLLHSSPAPYTLPIPTGGEVAAGCEFEYVYAYERGRGGMVFTGVLETNGVAVDTPVLGGAGR